MEPPARTLRRTRFPPWTAPRCSGPPCAAASPKTRTPKGCLSAVPLTRAAAGAQSSASPPCHYAQRPRRPAEPARGVADNHCRQRARSSSLVVPPVAVVLGVPGSRDHRNRWAAAEFITGQRGQAGRPGGRFPACRAGEPKISGPVIRRHRLGRRRAAPVRVDLNVHIHEFVAVSALPQPPTPPRPPRPARRGGGPPRGG